MTYRAELPDILYTVVQGLDLSMTIVDVQSSGTTHTVEVCDVKWLQAGYALTIDGNTYTVVSVDDADNVIVLTGAEPIEVNTFNLYRPKFFYGTPLDTKNQLQAIRLSTDKYPMFYLLLTYREVNYEGANPSIGRRATFRGFVLSDSNFEQWLTTDIHEYAIKPMSRLMQIIKEKIKATKVIFFTEEFEYESIPQYKFGVYITNKGATEGYFVDNLSGWEMAVNDLQIRKTFTCLPCPPMTILTGIGSMEVGDDFTVA